MGGSVGYAQRLTHRPPEMLGGQLGAKELLDAEAKTRDSTRQLAELLRGGGVVVHTGAGISTSAGIPDFRGPNGIWTLQAKGQDLPSTLLPLDQARPTLTHMAIKALHAAGIVRFVVSCNVDSLHLRSGLPRDALAELHGDCFAERCEVCEHEYIRDFEVTTVGFKCTGRKCVQPNCSGRLRDQVLDWEDALPPKELAAAERHCSEANVSLCLGTSLLITPSCNLPARTLRAGGSLAIVNLQKTPKDKQATLVIHAKVDRVMAELMQLLLVPVPRFIRTDHLMLAHKLGNASVQGQSFTLTVRSVHAETSPVPWLREVVVTFPDHPALKPACCAGTKLPLRLKRRTEGTLCVTSLAVQVDMHLVPSCTVPSFTRLHHIRFDDDCSDAGQVVFDLETTVLDYACSVAKPSVDEEKPAALPAPAPAKATHSGDGSGGEGDRAGEPDAPAAKAPRLC